MHELNPQTIPAGKTVVLEGIAINHSLQSEKSVIIEHPSSFSLPGGLTVKACLINIPNIQPCQLPVIVTNESTHDIVIPARSAVAELNLIQNIISKEQRVTPLIPASASDLETPKTRVSFW